MYVANLVLYLIGGIEVINGNLSMGMFIVFSSYFPKLISSSSYFFQLGRSYQDALIAFSRINEILKWGKELSGKFIPEQIDSIDIRNLSLCYGNNNILSNLNYSFEKGYTYAVIGPNGTGKSTLVQTIIGLFVNEIKGDVLFNGVSIKKCNMDEVRRKFFGIVEQEPLLLNDSIENNLFIQDGINDESLNNIFKVLEMDSYINSLPKGLNTVITMSNNNLSGGEKQKMSIARALLKDSEIMIFDKPTSALDKKASSQLLNYIRQIKQEKIVIFVTHNWELIDFCDNVIDLSEMYKSSEKSPTQYK